MNELEYAGFWIRLGAFLIDGLILAIVVGVPLSLIYGEQFAMGGYRLLGFWDLVLRYVLPVGATIWFWLRFEATPGKMALRLRIVDARTGDEISITQAVLRYLGYIVSSLAFCLGFIWIGIDRRKQAWHDKIAGTVVIRDTSTEPVRFESE